jgi:hypothetical protein
MREAQALACRPGAAPAPGVCSGIALALENRSRFALEATWSDCLSSLQVDWEVRIGPIDKRRKAALGLFGLASLMLLRLGSPLLRGGRPLLLTTFPGGRLKGLADDLGSDLRKFDARESSNGVDMIVVAVAVPVEPHNPFKFIGHQGDKRAPLTQSDMLSSAVLPRWWGRGFRLDAGARAKEPRLLSMQRRQPRQRTEESFAPRHEFRIFLLLEVGDERVRMVRQAEKVLAPLLLPFQKWIRAETHGFCQPIGAQCTENQSFVGNGAGRMSYLGFGEKF